MRGALEEALEADAEVTLERVWETVEPFESFVEDEQRTLSEAEEEVTSIQSRLDEMESRIDGIVNS